VAKRVIITNENESRLGKRVYWEKRLLKGVEKNERSDCEQKRFPIAHFQIKRKG